MIIYLDESKKILEEKIVFWWFISYNKHQFIQKLVTKKKMNYWFSEKLELKWTKDTWKKFFERMTKDIDFKFMNGNLLWAYIIWYDKDSVESYVQCILYIISRIYNKLKDYDWKMQIYADKMNLWSTSQVEKIITRKIKEEFPTKNKITFYFKWSENNCWVQLADLISYQMRLCNINGAEMDAFLSKNSLNLDLGQKFKITKKT